MADRVIQIVITFSIYGLAAVIWYQITQLPPEPIDAIMFACFAFGPSLWLTGLVSDWRHRRGRR